jgi:glycosyltransferase involved in cell wall biosynthesis
MPELGLCMTVRNEAANIVDCLGDVAQHFAEIVVIDTGSTDDTRELLRDGLGIEPICLDLDPAECLSLARPRNYGFDKLRTPWLMTLDADERIDRKQVAAFTRLSDADLPDGLFCRWPTRLADGVQIEDYKLSLFRNDHRHVGLIHDTAQPSLRAARVHAEWYPDLQLRHSPDCARREAKDSVYRWRLDCAREREPDWLRYHWFSGYLAYRQGQLPEAVGFLEPLHESRPELFPVESLNASMILATINATQGRGPATVAILADAVDYFAQVADDFEVRVNFRLGPWLRDAYEQARAGKLDIEPYLFPY